MKPQSAASTKRTSRNLPAGLASPKLRKGAAAGPKSHIRNG